MAHTALYISPTPSSEVINYRKHWSLLAGSLFIVLGLFALIFPFAAGLLTELVFGVLFLSAGLGQLLHAFGLQGWKGSLLAAAGGVLALLIGGGLLLFPLQGMFTLTLLIAFFLLLSSLFRASLAFQLKPHDGWGWLLFSAILAFLLGGIILTQWPEAAMWVIGMLLGIDFIFSGWWLLMLGMSKRTVTS
jgi:uncharacterized membrane protein HdeD (DUF308 family)